MSLLCYTINDEIAPGILSDNYDSILVQEEGTLMLQCSLEMLPIVEGADPRIDMGLWFATPCNDHDDIAKGCIASVDMSIWQPISTHAVELLDPSGRNGHALLYLPAGPRASLCGDRRVVMLDHDCVPQIVRSARSVILHEALKLHQTHRARRFAHELLDSTCHTSSLQLTHAEDTETLKTP